jgi:hypothetical protein
MVRKRLDLLSSINVIDMTPFYPRVKDRESLSDDIQIRRTGRAGSLIQWLSRDRSYSDIRTILGIVQQPAVPDSEKYLADTYTTAFIWR